jgi:hypothetical protein
MLTNKIFTIELAGGLKRAGNTFFFLQREESKHWNLNVLRNNTPFKSMDTTVNEFLQFLQVNTEAYILNQLEDIDRLCGLWSEFLATDLEVQGSIPGTTRFSEK